MNDVRSEYRELSPADKQCLADLKSAGEAYIDAIKALPRQGRETALAITNAEQSVMWAVKGFTA